MGTWNAFYVKAQKDNDTTTAATRESFPDAEIEASSQFVGVRMPDDAFEAPESDLSALSSRLGTDVIWLGFQSTVDAFQFHHWQAGEHVRALVYGCFEEERTWERADGQPEPWERAVFFSPKELASTVRHIQDESERQEMERIWREGGILPGRFAPGLDSRDCAHQIAAHYGFPHYGL